MAFIKNIQPEPIDMTEVYNEPDVEKQLLLETKKLLAHRQKTQMADMRDCEYYAVVVFGNKNDKDLFLSAVSSAVTVEGDTFVDGYEFASSIGIEIQCSASLPEPHYVQSLKIKKHGNSYKRRKKTP